MKRETTTAVRLKRCLNPDCPDNRDAVKGHHGYCSPCGQAVWRRIKQGYYKKEELVARGKLLLSPIDNWLQSQ